jgi:mono/diheme cytochrome c family protein
MRIEIKATVMAMVASGGVLGATFGFASLLQPAKANSGPALQATTRHAQMAAISAGTAEGHRLFDLNCAHCHGDDARGDEGPSLFNLALSDERIAKRIREGIKGEMPKFGSKFNDSEIQALIAYLRTLKDGPANAKVDDSILGR